MPRDPKIEALIRSIMEMIETSKLPPKDVARALLSIAAANAVKDGSFQDCVEFEDTAHDFFHSAVEILETRRPHKAKPPVLKVVH